MARKLAPHENYARVRHMLGKTHYDMGRLFGVSHAASSRWENGSRGIPEIVNAISLALWRGDLSLAVVESWMENAKRFIAEEKDAA